MVQKEFINNEAIFCIQLKLINRGYYWLMNDWTHGTKITLKIRLTGQVLKWMTIKNCDNMH